MFASQSAAATSSPAFFTLLGVAITALVTILVVFVKDSLERKSETRRHAFELEKLKLNALSNQEDRHWLQAKDCIIRYLGATHLLYSSISKARRERRVDRDDSRYRSALAAGDPREGQACLDELKLLAVDDKVFLAAQELWAHIRGDDVPRGAAVEGERWVIWKEEYWTLRSALMELSRQYLNLLSPGDPN